MSEHTEDRFGGDPVPLSLGERYYDYVTGIEGVATALHIYQFGCYRVTLEYSREGEPYEQTFDLQRLVDAVRRVPVNVVSPLEFVEIARTGGPRSDPPRRGVPPR